MSVDSGLRREANEVLDDETINRAEITSPKIEALKGDIKNIDAEMQKTGEGIVEGKDKAVKKEAKQKHKELENKKSEKLSLLDSEVTSEAVQEKLRSVSPSMSPGTPGSPGDISDPESPAAKGEVLRQKKAAKDQAEKEVEDHEQKRIDKEKEAAEYQEKVTELEALAKEKGVDIDEIPDSDEEGPKVEVDGGRKSACGSYFGC